ncbi:MAG: pirin family protein [Bdellovibrionota bacterium]
MSFDLLIQSRERDLGGFSVRRLIPHSSRRMVGPFVFFDHMGPADFPPGQGINVRPHPHIHLATVTYLFEGAVRHRDSLGSDPRIEPGAINWMTAGRGVVHSERAASAAGGRLHGIQLWVALPKEKENIDPSFTHHPAETLPSFTVGRAKVKVMLGSAFGRNSPVPLLSDLFYVDITLPRGETIEFDPSGRELALYPVSGRVSSGKQTLEPYTFAVASPGSLTITAETDAHFVLLGGVSLGKRFIDWNFVSSEEQNITQAKADWAGGPGSARFPKVPGDDQEFIPLPSD